MKNSLDVGSMDIMQDEPLKVGESGLDLHPIEVPSVADMVPDAIKLEAFMHEIVEVYLPLPKGETRNTPVTVTVSGDRQHVFYNTPQQIKRKYLEVLARSTITNYEQDIEEMYRAGELPRSNVTQAYPFSVLRDTPEGISWLQAIQRQGS
jgi:hypothetical protein